MIDPSGQQELCPLGCTNTGILIIDGERYYCKCDSGSAKKALAKEPDIDFQDPTVITRKRKRRMKL